MQPLTNLPPAAYLKIAEEVKVPLVNLVKAITLFEEGATVPFLARYRKEVTGNMNEEQLRLLEDRLAYYRDLEDRRQTVLRSIEEQGKLTPDLRAKLEAILEKNELEDLYLPYKPKRRTRASAAREQGLEPLAGWLWAQQPDGRTPESFAATLLNPEKGVETAEQALAGARDIIAERISDDPDIRRELRKTMWEEGVILARKSEKADELLQQQKETRSKYEMYHDFHEAVAKIPSHRLLAIRRGVKEGFLTSDIQLAEAGPVERILVRVIRDRSSAFAPQLEAAARDGYQRLLNPSIQTEVRQALKERSDAEAIRVFQENVESLLLAPPAGLIGVLGVDPGYRNGCKVAVVDETGKYLESATVYPHEPKNDVEGARAALKDLVAKHNVRAVAIGNGTASRETDLFVRALLRDEKSSDEKLAGVFSIVVSEAGASVYSASRLAREELPDLDVTLRGAASIARRLQDPLAELVKVDPKSIGVGQYQHDVDQVKLSEGLHGTVESCVNRVGVDANTASFALLKYVAGLNERVAKRIIERRNNSGRFASRAQFKEVPGFGDRTFEQAAGFLRVRGGENPLDQTGVHPESYAVVEKMAASLGVSVAELIARPELIEQCKLEDFQTETAGLFTLHDIREELRKPGRDPRDKFVAPHYRDDVLQIADLKEGMELEGIVTNVTNFGAFVDVGVHQDGLVHVSELSDKFIKDPREAVKVGDIIKVRVLAADVAGKRISLSRKPVRRPVEKAEPPRRAAGAPQKVQREARAQSENGRKPPRDGKPRREPQDAAARKPAEPVAASGERPKQSRPPQPKAKPLTMEEKLALLQTKFRTRV
ncbi:MAG TPA: Tex family protein [Bryobacterales bacterium]|nr:Tex family protein [Bryobacterales bacterium]